jgi:hypothetical protein
MVKYFFLLLIILTSFTISAEIDEFILKTEEDTVTIKLSESIKDFQTVQLFRKRSGQNQVNIFEFPEPESSFSEPAESGTCYFIKVYKNSDKPFISDTKCISKTFFIGGIETALVLFLLLLIFSFFAPGFIAFRFLSSGSDNAGEIARSIKILAGEDSKNVLLHSSSDWIGDPLNISVNSYFKRLLTEENESVATTTPDVLAFTESNDGEMLKKVPVIYGQRPFLTNVLRDFTSRSAVFHIVENSPESNLDSFKDIKEKRKMVFSASLSGAVTDLLLKRKAFISIEPLVFDSQFSKTKTPDSSGAYLFLVVIASAVLLGSVLKTLGIEHIINSLILLFAGGQ